MLSVFDSLVHFSNFCKIWCFLYKIGLVVAAILENNVERRRGCNLAAGAPDEETPRAEPRTFPPLRAPPHRDAVGVVGDLRHRLGQQHLPALGLDGSLQVCHQGGTVALADYGVAAGQGRVAVEPVQAEVLRVFRILLRAVRGGRGGASGAVWTNQPASGLKARLGPIHFQTQCATLPGRTAHHNTLHPTAPPTTRRAPRRRNGRARAPPA